MRCSACLSYIPSGSTDPEKCPNCGAKQTSASSVTKTTSTVSVPAENSYSEKEKLPFAPYFTVRTKLSFAIAGMKSSPSMGSISFGPEGFSVVHEDGKRLEQILYRNLLDFSVYQQSIRITNVNRSSTSALEKDTERLLTLYHPWLPKFLGGIQKKRAVLFCELLGVIKEGLNPDQVEHFRRSLA